MRPIEGADRILGVIALPFASAGAYLGALSVLGLRRPTPPPADLSARFAIVVPAHNEALGIADTVESLHGIDYPAERVRILVVADNCSDDTARCAREAGADVLERVDAQRRGKGYALDLAFHQILAEDRCPHAVVVVDADTRVAPNLLQAFAGRLAAGSTAMQASYRVANHGANWRTTLMSVAFSCMHDVRSVGRERLGLSTGLRGNGMCFATDTLRAVPHRAASLVEDVEHGIDLAEQGIRVTFVHETHVEAEMPEAAGTAASQRRRWERGRSQLRRQRAPRLLGNALRRGDPMRADLAVDLLIPPLAQLAVSLTALSVAAALSSVLLGRRSRSAPAVLVGIAGLGTHVAAGWRESGTGVDGLRAILHVPSYIAWKLGLGRSPGSAGAGLVPGAGAADEWVRTTRNAEMSRNPE